MMQAVVAWLLRALDDLPGKLGWVLLVLALTGASVAYGVQTAKMSKFADEAMELRKQDLELAKADLTQKTEIGELRAQVREAVNAVAGLTDEMKQYRLALQKENERLRALADARERRREGRE
jgi:plasmid stabilization system protein ParE